MRFLKRLIRALVSVAYVVVMLAVGIVTVIWLIVMLLITYPFDKERVVLHWFSKIAARLVFYWSPVWHLEIEGLEHIDYHKAYVITVNHQSYLDIPLMYFVPSLNFKWVSKYELRQMPIIGIILHLHDDITIRRGKASAAIDLMEKGSQHLGSGTSIMIFPEGTRSRDGEVHHYKEGAFRLAKSNGVEVLPCVIDGTRTAIDRFGLHRNTFTVRVLPPIGVDRVAACEPKILAEEVETLTRDNLLDIRSGKHK